MKFFKSEKPAEIELKDIKSQEEKSVAQPTAPKAISIPRSNSQPINPQPVAPREKPQGQPMPMAYSWHTGVTVERNELVMQKLQANTASKSTKAKSGPSDTKTTFGF